MKNRNITQSSYSQEAIETAKFSKDIDDADGEAITLREKTKDLDVRRIAECAFRRGFTQGAVSAINAYDSGVPKEEIYEWYNGLLVWRYKKHNGEFDMPKMFFNGI